MTDAESIKQSMIESIEAVDSSVDVRKGPFFDVVISPVADEIAPAFEEIENVKNMMSALATGNAATMSSDYLNALGINARVSPQAGRRAVARVCFYFNALPAGEIVIPAGTSVSTTDGRYVYTTDNTISGLNRTTAVSYYVAATGRYEIPVTVTATAEGAAYNIPANRITYMLTPVDGVDGVYNPTRSEQGQDAAGPEQYLADIRQAFIGADTASTAGITRKITDSYGTNVRVSYITGNNGRFVRPVQGAGLDVYVNTVGELFTEDLFVTSSTTEFPLKHAPVLGIEQVTVNGVQASFEFVQDTDARYAGSVRANDRVRVPSAVSGDVVRVVYRYDSITNWIQSNVLDRGVDDYFGVDGLARRATSVPLYVAATVTVGTVATGLVESLRTYLIETVADNTFDTVDPETLRADILEGFTNIRGLTFQVFGRTAASAPRALVSNGVEAFSLAAENIVLHVQ